MTPTELKQARQSLGLTQLQLAEWMGVSDRTVKHWEAGSRNADATAVLLLTAYLDGYRPRHLSRVAQNRREKE
jgi:DNA-binding transcriptional regulator YiaG